MVRLTIEVVEENVVDAVGEPTTRPSVRDSIVRYAREVAFATAEVYARAAEMRGAWDARLEALVVDSVLRAEADETVRSRASALGWESKGDVVVVLGRVPDGDAAGAASRSSTTYAARARHVGLDALCAVQGDRMVVVLGGVDNPDKAGAAVADALRRGSGGRRPGRRRTWCAASISARAATAGLRAAPRLAGRPAAGHQRRPAARARALRRRPRPPPAGPGGLPAAGRRRAADARHGLGVPRPRRLDRGHRPGDVRARRTPCATGCAGPPRSPGCPRPTPAHAYTYRVALTLGRLTAPDSTATAPL